MDKKEDNMVDVEKKEEFLDTMEEDSTQNDENNNDQFDVNHNDQFDDSVNDLQNHEIEDDAIQDRNIHENDKKEELGKSSNMMKEVISWVKVIAVALILSFVLNRYIVFSFSVPTESMVDTINVDDRIMSLRCAYWFSDPQRGDIVVFPYPDDPTQNYIKRIIGLPGETIEGKDGIVYINGEPLDESDYVMSDLDEDFGPYEIPEDSYFMMGDNRDVSLDARYWENKFVKKEDIIAKAIFRFYPSFGMLE